MWGYCISQYFMLIYAHNVNNKEKAEYYKKEPVAR